MWKFLYSLSLDKGKGFIQIGKNIINADKIETILVKTIRIAFIMLFMYLIIRIGTIIIDKFIKKQSRLKISIDEKKAKTLAGVLKSILRYGVYIFGISAIVTQIFGTIGITFASIGGVAIGLGAQNIIKDVINGFFILFEDQFAVGDYINIGDKGGIVESIGLRLTKIKDFNGDIHIVPNGSIGQVTNHSRSDMRVLVDVDVAYEEDTDRVIEVLNLVCEKFKDNKNIVDGPKVIGVIALKDSGVTIRVWAKAKAMTQWECENEIRKEIKKALDKYKIEIPYPRRKIINSKQENNNI